MSPGRCLLLVGCLALAAAFHGDTYEEKVKNWKDQHTQKQFIDAFNRETKGNLKGGRADRLYKHVISLLDNKGARFTDDGLTYYLPITHHLTILPDVVAEGIETLMTVLRKVYYGTLEFVHDEAIELHHQALDVFMESGAAKVMTTLCGTYLAFAALSWVINRFTDGLSPTQRKLNKDTRERAAEYIARKREL